MRFVPNQSRVSEMSLWSGLCLDPGRLTTRRPTLDPARLVSTPSPKFSGLGSALASPPGLNSRERKPSPNLGGSTPRVSPRALNLMPAFLTGRLSPTRLPIPPRGRLTSYSIVKALRETQEPPGAQNKPAGDSASRYRRQSSAPNKCEARN